MAEKLTRRTACPEDAFGYEEHARAMYDADEVDSLVADLWALVEKWRFKSGVVDDLVYKASGELACCADEMAALLPVCPVARGHPR